MSAKKRRTNHRRGEKGVPRIMEKTSFKETAVHETSKLAQLAPEECLKKKEKKSMC